MSIYRNGSEYRSTIRLKERCHSCNGTGVYTAPHTTNWCWTCEGKGWVYHEMRKPDPKWAAMARKAATR